MLHLTLTILLGIIASISGAITFYALKRINNYEEIILHINTTVESIKSQLKLIYPYIPTFSAPVDLFHTLLDAVRHRPFIRLYLMPEFV